MTDFVLTTLPFILCAVVAAIAITTGQFGAGFWNDLNAFFGGRS